MTTFTIVQKERRVVINESLNGYYLLEDDCIIAHSKSENSLKGIARTLNLYDKQTRALKIARETFLCNCQCDFSFKVDETTGDRKRYRIGHLCQICEALAAIDEILK